MSKKSQQQRLARRRRLKPACTPVDLARLLCAYSCAEIDVRAWLSLGVAEEHPPCLSLSMGRWMWVSDDEGFARWIKEHRPELVEVLDAAHVIVSMRDTR